MRLRGALLGAGNIALKSHAPQWAEDPRLREEAEIVAVADLSPSNLEAVRAVLPEARLYSAAESLLEKEAIDFVDICTPPFTHRPLVEAASRSGLHVVCEKPLAPTEEEAEAIAAAVSRAGVVFQPCHQYHYSPQWQAVLGLVPRIGRVYLAEYEVQRTAANPGNANWSPTWRTDPALAGGGILADHGAHIFYQLRGVLGDPKTVQATVRTLHHQNYQVEDTALVTLDFEGRLAHVRLSWAARSRCIRFRLVGERGEIIGDDQTLVLNAETQERIDFGCGMSQNSSHAEWYTPLLQGFVDRIRSGDATQVPLEEGVWVTRLICRAYESSEAGRALPLVPVTSEEEVRQELGTLASLSLPAGEVAEEAPAMTPVERRRRVWVWRGVAAAGLLGVSSWAFHDVNGSSLWTAMSSAQPGWLLLAAAVNFVVLFFQSARWLALVRPLSAAARISQAFKAMVVGYAVSTVVPARAGELARIEYLGRHTGISRMSVVGSVILDQLVNAAGLLAGVAILPLFLDVPLWIRQSGWFALVLFILGTALVTAIRPRNATPARENRTSRLPFRGIANALASVRHGLLATTDPRALTTSIAASLVAWGLEINVTSLSLRAVGLHLPIAASILVLIAVNLALAMPFAPPGNLGTLEIGATLALLEFGVPKEQALAFALCYHLLQVIPIGILGVGLLTWGVAPQRRQAA